MTILSILLFYVLPALGGYRVFEKAGVAGWIAFIPVLNLLGVLRVLKLSLLWIIPFVFFYPVAHFIAAVLVAWRFGKGTLYGLGLAFAPFIFVPVLGFGPAQPKESV